MKKIAMFGISALLITSLAHAIPNPASVYCVKQGNKSVIMDNKGYCVFKDNTYCEEWAFFRNKCKAGVNKMPIPKATSSS